MKIAIVTFWYNEEVLAPFFLKHYNYVDDIFVYLDTDTDDSTSRICKAHSNVTLKSMAFPGGYSSITKINKINSVVKQLRHDWTYVIDADELIQQPKQYKGAKEFLLKQEQVGYTLVIAQMYQVYRHATDGDLDISKPVLAQRCHGDPSLTTPFNKYYVKPIVVKPQVDIVWRPGCHLYNRNSRIKVAKERYIGAHWKMADDSFVIKRRIQDRQLKFSAKQIKERMGYQDIYATKESILAELAAHRNCPDVMSSLLGDE